MAVGRDTAAERISSLPTLPVLTGHHDSDKSESVSESSTEVSRTIKIYLCGLVLVPVGKSNPEWNRVRTVYPRLF